MVWKWIQYFVSLELYLGLNPSFYFSLLISMIGLTKSFILLLFRNYLLILLINFTLKNFSVFIFMLFFPPLFFFFSLFSISGRKLVSCADWAYYWFALENLCNYDVYCCLKTVLVSSPAKVMWLSSYCLVCFSQRSHHHSPV